MAQQTPPRSFNTVKHSNRKERLARQARGRMLLLAMCTVVLAILISLVVFAVCAIADASKKKDPKPDPSEGQAGNVAEPIKYGQITKTSESVHTGELIVVNKNLEYHFPDATTASKQLISMMNNKSNDNGKNIYQLRDSTLRMDSIAFRALDNMMLEYYEIFEDTSILVTDAYRSEKEQEKYSTAVGHSEHHTGFCVTLKQYGTNSAIVDLESDHWIYQNCHKYGFIVRYPEGKEDITGVPNYTYCFRYVGIAHASYITQNGLALEEYVELLKVHTINNSLKFTGADAHSYAVYYVPAASSDVITISAPTNYAYTVSGDNSNGFIVTVDLSTPKE